MVSGRTQTGEEFRDPLTLARSLPADELACLTALDESRSLRAVLGTWLALGLLVVLGGLLWQWHKASVLVAAVAMAGVQHALFVLAHEAAHYRLSKHRWLNDLLGRAGGALTGISMRTYRVTHRLHHNHLNQPQDPDMALHGGYPRGVGYLIRKLLVDLSGWTAPKTYAYFFGAPAINIEQGRAQRPLDDTSVALRQAARHDRWLVLAVQLLMPALAWFAAGLEGLAFYGLIWVLPAVTVLQALLRLRAVAEHGAPVDAQVLLLAARTNVLDKGPAGWLLRWFVFPHHVNYHLAHHCYPAVPHYRLPELHRRMTELGITANAEVRSFGQSMQRVFAPKRLPLAQPTITQ